MGKLRLRGDHDLSVIKSEIAELKLNWSLTYLLVQSSFYSAVPSLIHQLSIMSHYIIFILIFILSS